MEAQGNLECTIKRCFFSFMPTMVFVSSSVDGCKCDAPAEDQGCIMSAVAK